MKAFLPVGLVLTLLAGPAGATGYTLLNAGIASLQRDDDDLAIGFLSQAISAPDLPQRFLPHMIVHRPAVIGIHEAIVPEFCPLIRIRGAR